jgi:hypothetical protein
MGFLSRRGICTWRMFSWCLELARLGESEHFKKGKYAEKRAFRLQKVENTLTQNTLSGTF